jgi:hypothetical protein
MKQEVMGRTNRLLPFNIVLSACKTTSPTSLRCRRNVFTETLPSNDRWIHRQTHRLSFDKTRTLQKTTHPTILLSSVCPAWYRSLNSVDFSASVQPSTKWIVKVKFMLRPTVSRSVCLAIKHPSGA